MGCPKGTNLAWCVFPSNAVDLLDSGLTIFCYNNRTELIMF